MTNEAMEKAVQEATVKAKSLEMLYDYTKFHIGIYITLTAAYITVATAKIGAKPLVEPNPNFMWPAIITFMIAGLAGGVIVSSLTQRVGGSSIDFLSGKIGPWDWKKIHFSTRAWTYIEHTSFWLGLIFSVLSFVFATT